MSKKEYSTGSRVKILDFLMAASDRAVSVSDIREYMEKESCPVNVTTIYRYLEKLEADGRLLKYAAAEQGKAAYQYVEDGHKCDEHLHLRCVCCGRAEHLDCHFMEDISRHIAEEHGFSLQCRNSVLYGICSACREKCQN